ncbi:MAG: hypothetical protein [Arizlama microvirus]|nr:MAG: hypothetical protein [Arizlama microvirus]
MSKRLDENGYETLDPKPRAIPAKIRKISETDRFRAMVQGMLSDAAANNGMESFEEANDFYVEDDFFPMSPHELTPELEEQFNDFVDRSIAESKGPQDHSTPEMAAGLRLRNRQTSNNPPVVPGDDTPPKGEVSPPDPKA